MKSKPLPAGQAADLQLDHRVNEPAARPPGVGDVRSILLLLKDRGLISRGTIVSADYKLADELLDSGAARAATDPDIAAWGRPPVEI